MIVAGNHVDGFFCDFDAFDVFDVFGFAIGDFGFAIGDFGFDALGDFCFADNGRGSARSCGIV